MRIKVWHGFHIVAVLCLILVNPIFAEDDLYKTFQLNYVALDYLDVCSTLYGLEIGLVEANPLAKWYIKNPVLTFAVHVVLDVAIIKLTDVLFKRNKKLAWIMIVGLNLIKGYIVYRNFKLL